MKRIVVAVTFLAIIGVLSSVTLSMQRTAVNELLDSIDVIQQTLPADEEEALRQTNRLVEDFHNKTRYFPLFMRHSDISKIEETAVILPVMLQTGEAEHFQAELARCRNMLEKLSELEIPTWENIF